MAGPQARIYHCPSCGGPASNPRSRSCEFCEGPLLPMGTPDPRTAVRCSSCAGLVSAGASYCPQCGDPLAHAASTPVPHACPACPGSGMEAYRLQPTPAHPQGWAVHGCRSCGGVWVDTSTLDAMLASAAQRLTGTGDSKTVKRRELSMTGAVVYRPCSVCGETMARRNFARISGVIVDECRHHGSFFDAGELEDVLAFVRSGGMLLARQRRSDEIDRERRAAERSAALSKRSPLMREVDPLTHRPLDDDYSSVDWGDGGPDLGVAFLRWAGAWVRNMFR